MNIDLAFISSIKEYVDRSIIQKLGAWKVADIPLFSKTDDKKSAYKILASGPRQWVFDSGITNSIVSASGLAGGWSAAQVDYKNSRLLLPAATATTGNPATVNGAYKLYNSYVSSLSDEELFLATDFGKNPEMLTQTAGTNADSYYSPCYFYKLGRTMGFTSHLARSSMHLTSF